MKLCETYPGDIAREGTFISIVTTEPTAKTARFEVRVTEDDQSVAALGEIRWWGPWRCYSFFPAPDTLYEPKCLTEITQFLKDLMEERKS